MARRLSAPGHGVPRRANGISLRVPGHGDGRTVGTALLAPLFDDHALERTMQSERDGRLELREQLPHWAEPWRDYQPPGAQQFDAYFHAPDAAFSIILFTDGAGVRALWKNGFDASLQVALATQWLDALNQRDLQALARVTSYPFQLRDSEAESQCGARQANNAGAAGAEYADRSRTDARLRAGYVSRLASSGACYALARHAPGRDQCRLRNLAQDGVRAFWKRGSVLSGD